MNYDWIYILLLVFLVFWLANYFLVKKDIYLESFRPIVEKILLESGFPAIPFDIRPSKFKTFTLNKKHIHLVNKKITGEKYNTHTILFVILHEIAHILSSEHHHTKLFYQIEKKLYQTAIRFGYLDTKQLDKTYPCFE